MKQIWARKPDKKGVWLIVLFTNAISVRNMILSNPNKYGSYYDWEQIQ